MPVNSGVDCMPEGVTVSLGVAQLEESDNINDLLRKADTALYSAKKKGRNRLEIFKQSIKNNEPAPSS